MCRLLRQNGVVPFLALVFLELPVVLHHPGVVHADQGVLATLCIEDDLRVTGILTLQDFGPELVFVLTSDV